RGLLPPLRLLASLLNLAQRIGRRTALLLRPMLALVPLLHSLLLWASLARRILVLLHRRRTAARGLLTLLLFRRAARLTLRLLFALLLFLPLPLLFLRCSLLLLLLL